MKQCRNHRNHLVILVEVKKDFAFLLHIIFFEILFQFLCFFSFLRAVALISDRRLCEPHPIGTGAAGEGAGDQRAAQTDHSSPWCTSM